jgi:Flp pilus assembly protein TadG
MTRWRHSNRNRHRNRERSRGQTLVEFALVLPVFLLLTLGVVDGARIFSAYIAITNAAREGALYAASGTNYTKWCSTTTTVSCPTGYGAGNQSADPDNIAYRVQQESQGLTAASVKLDPPTCADAAGTSVTCGGTAVRVTIKVRYEMSLLVPFIGALFGNPVKMDATTSAMIQ